MPEGGTEGWRGGDAASGHTKPDTPRGSIYLIGQARRNSDLEGSENHFLLPAQKDASQKGLFMRRQIKMMPTYLLLVNMSSALPICGVGSAWMALSSCKSRNPIGWNSHILSLLNTLISLSSP